MSDRFSKFSLVGFVAFGILIVAVLYWVGSINEQHSTVAKAVSVPNLLSSSALRIFLPKESQAKCLDGSSPAYYLRHGSGSGKNKWIILFEGGGWCYDKEQCYHRSKTVLGSSKHYPQYISADHMNFYISQAADANPLMYNWNTVLVRYCDGSSFAGNSEMKYQVSLKAIMGYSTSTLYSNCFVQLYSYRDRPFISKE